MSEEITRLEAEVREATQALNEAKQALHAARLAAAPVSVGDVVRSRHQDGKLGRVVRVHPRWNGKLWVVVNPMKKNGEFGIAERNWYDDWDLVEGDA